MGNHFLHQLRTLNIFLKATTADDTTSAAGASHRGTKTFIQGREQSEADEPEDVRRTETYAGTLRASRNEAMRLITFNGG